MAQLAAEFVQTAASTRHLSGVLKTCWDAFLQRRERQRVRAALYDLRDSELGDFGIARCDIEYVALHRNIDPRDI